MQKLKKLKKKKMGKKQGHGKHNWGTYMDMFTGHPTEWDDARVLAELR